MLQKTKTVERDHDVMESDNGKPVTLLLLDRILACRKAINYQANRVKIT